MRAFPDPSASVDRDGAGDGAEDDSEIVPAPQRDADMGFEQESIHPSSASSSSETQGEIKRKEEIRRLKAADRATQRKRNENAPPPPIDTQQASRLEIAMHSDIAELQRQRDEDHDKVEDLVYGLSRHDAINKVQLTETRRAQEELANKTYEIIGFPSTEGSRNKYMVLDWILEKANIPREQIAEKRFQRSGSRARNAVDKAKIVFTEPAPKRILDQYMKNNKINYAVGSFGTNTTCKVDGQNPLRTRYPMDRKRPRSIPAPCDFQHSKQTRPHATDLNNHERKLPEQRRPDMLGFHTGRIPVQG